MTKTIKPLSFSYLEAEIMRDLLKHQIENDIVPLEYEDTVYELYNKLDKYLLDRVGDADDNL